MTYFCFHYSELIILNASYNSHNMSNPAFSTLTEYLVFMQALDRWRKLLLVLALHIVIHAGNMNYIILTGYLTILCNFIYL